jgi:carbamoyl-phosphate synthase large subunit
MIEAAPDTVLLPPVTEAGYFDTLLAACIERRVRLLVSLNDLELPGLARQRERFAQAGVVAAVSSPEVVDLCFDKWATYETLKRLGIPTPRTVLGLEASRELSFPVYVKPRWGSASIGVEKARDRRELEAAYAWAERRAWGVLPGGGVLVQEALEGEEYGVDIVNDLDGVHRSVIVKRKLAMRAGETDIALTVEEERIAALARRIGEALGHRGLMDCDAFLTPRGAFILELNPRFGGGYPFSHVAGANVPAALLAWAAGREARAEWLRARPGVLSAKCDRLVHRAPG